MAGYGMHRGDLGSNEASDNNFSIGASLSPYAPYRKYLQAEVFLSYQNYPDRFVNQGQSIDTIINGTAYSGFGTINQKNKTISLDIVPVQLRYNLNDFLGLGVGAQVTADAFSRISPTQVFYLFDSTGMNPIRIQKKQNDYNQWFKKWDFALFGDVQLGQVRAGPEQPLAERRDSVDQVLAVVEDHQDPLRPQLRHQLVREAALAVQLLRHGGDPLLRELAHGGADELVLLVEIEVQRERRCASSTIRRTP